MALRCTIPDFGWTGGGGGDLSVMDASWQSDLGDGWWPTVLQFFELDRSR